MSDPHTRLEFMAQQLRESQPAPSVESEDLARLSVGAMVRDMGGTQAPERPFADVRLSGRGVREHEVAVQEAVGILGPLQGVVSAIGQALRGSATARGRIPGDILSLTTLWLSPRVSPGSVVFHLAGTGEEVTGDELPGSVGTDTFVDIVMAKMVGLLDQAALHEADLHALAEALRPFGARTAKHLNDLTTAVVNSDIDVDVAWRTPAGRRLRAQLHRTGALALQEAISRDREQVSVITLVGTLETVSVIRDAELVTDTGQRITLNVGDELSQNLGPYFHTRVSIDAEMTTTWNISAGTETRSYRLIAIRPAEEI